MRNFKVEGKQIHFWDDRFYTKDDVNFYPGATTVLSVWPKGKPYDDWLKKLGPNADQVVREAANRGSNVHNAIELYTKGHKIRAVDENGENPVYTKDEWRMLARYVEFEAQVSPEIVAVEPVLVSDNLEIGGQLDQVSYIDGELWYIDHKTSNGIHFTNHMQGVAYSKLWNEMNPDNPIEHIGILWLNAKTRKPAKGKVQGRGWQLIEVPRETWGENWNMFQHTYAIWKHLNPNYKPYNYTMPVEYKRGN